jgi:hypothetical protein
VHALRSKSEEPFQKKKKIILKAAGLEVSDVGPS